MITWEHPDIQDKELFRQLYKIQAQEQGIFRRLFGKRELDPAWLEGLTELSLTGLQIKSFAFLRLCPNLKELELGRCDLTQVQDTGSYVQLADLTIAGETLSDPSFLYAFPNVTMLSLCDIRQFGDLSVLGGMDHLDTLSLIDTAAFDLYLLRDCEQLRMLSICAAEEDPAPFDFRDLAALKQLHALDLDGMGLTDLSLLAPLTQLRNLYVCSEGELYHAESLTQLNHLQNLILEGKNFTRDTINRLKERFSYVPTCIISAPDNG